MKTSEPDLTTIEFRSSNSRRDETDLQNHLRDVLQVKVFCDLEESADWVGELSRLYIPAAESAAGKLVEYTAKNHRRSGN